MNKGLLFRLRRNRRGGFSLLETLIAVAMISVVGMIVVQLLQKNTINLMWNRQTRKAALLADMVLEKYDYLATTDFKTLETLNQVKVPANAFFVTGMDTQGYEGMTITTVANMPVGDGSRKLDVTIYWGAGGARQNYKISKFLAPGAGTPGGAPVFVYVKDENGVGMPGFEVRAWHHFNAGYTNSIGTNEVIGFTDANGLGVLSNVSVTQNPMLIYARKLGTDAKVRKDSADPLFVQGYYGIQMGAWAYKHITVTQASANSVQFVIGTDLWPLGGVSGTVTKIGGGSPAGVAIAMVANAVLLPYDNIVNGWSYYATTEDGTFEFNNIAPSAIHLYIRGVEGSHYLHPEGSPQFKQGYSGFGGPDPTKPWYFPRTMGHPAGAVGPVNAFVRKLGNLSVTTRDESNVYVPNASISIHLQDVGMYGNSPLVSVQTDDNGMLKIFNVFAVDDQPIEFTSARNPEDCSYSGHYMNSVFKTCQPIITNDVVLTLKGGASVEGILADSASTPLDGIQTCVMGLAGSYICETTGASGTPGAFKICGINPVPQFHPNWPQVVLQYTDLTSRRVAGTFTGYVYQGNLPSMRLPGYPVTLEEQPGFGGEYIHNGTCESDVPNAGNTLSDTNIVADAGGNYGPVCAYLKVKGIITGTASGGPIDYSVGTVMISTTVAIGILGTRTTDYFISDPTFQSLNAYTVTAGQGLITKNIAGKIGYHLISGAVRDSGSGVGLDGITFNPCAGCEWGTTSCPVTTSAGGSFGPIRGCVSGTGVAGSPGKVEVTVPSGQSASNNGKSYGSDTQSATLTNPPLPTVPLILNFTLTETGGGM